MVMMLMHPPIVISARMSSGWISPGITNKCISTDVHETEESGDRQCQRRSVGMLSAIRLHHCQAR